MDLLPLFEQGKAARFKDRALTVEQAEQFLPKEFFPIESESDFLRKLLIAFQRGRIFHLQEETRAAPIASLHADGELTLLPSPRPGQ